MAERRMFAKRITDSDAFLDLPLSAQALYFHIGMNARDKGIIYNAKSISKAIGCPDEALDLLVEKNFLIPVEEEWIDENVFMVVHWYENNGIGETARKRNNYAYRMWRNAVIERDGCCVMCGSVDKLEAHHIKSFAEYPELRLDIDNGKTLCHKCHAIVHMKGDANGKEKDV